MRPLSVGLALALWSFAAAWPFWAESWIGRLPADYGAETIYDAAARSRRTPQSPWEHVKLDVHRIDHTMVSTAARSMIQSDLYWSLPDGTVLFENSGIYAVDRSTRQNLAGYGDVSRSGQFLVAPDAGDAPFTIWDTSFIGARAVHLDRVDVVEGLTIHVYRYRVRGLDETEGFSHLPDVPERFRALTNGDGTISVEPLTGTLVDYHERGRSYFVKGDGATGGDFFVWAAELAPETRQARLREAIAGHRRVLWIRWGVPALFVFAGLVAMLAGRRASVGGSGP